MDLLLEIGKFIIVKHFKFHRDLILYIEDYCCFYKYFQKFKFKNFADLEVVVTEI